MVPDRKLGWNWVELSECQCAHRSAWFLLHNKTTQSPDRGITSTHHMPRDLLISYPLDLLPGTRSPSMCRPTRRDQKLLDVNVIIRIPEGPPLPDLRFRGCCSPWWMQRTSNYYGVRGELLLNLKDISFNSILE